MTGAGVTHELVLRRFIRPNWKYPGLPRREAKVLDAAGARALPRAASRRLR